MARPADSLMPGFMPRVNKLVTNRIQGLWAPWLPPWAMVVHVGRKSGRTYENPIVAVISGSTLAIGLPYGAGAQWVRNLQAAGGGELRRRGKRLAFTNVRVVPKGTGTGLPRGMVAAGKRMPVLLAELT